GLLLLVEGINDRGDDVVRHGNVNLAGEFDEACAEIEFLRLPGKIKRIDGNAVSAKSGPGIERLEPERLRGSRINNFPDIQVHAEAEHLQFVDECDVDAAVNVFQELSHFGRCRRRNANHAVEYRSIE